jgi:hypothetical protein
MMESQQALLTFRARETGEELNNYVLKVTVPATYNSRQGWPW